MTGSRIDPAWSALEPDAPALARLHDRLAAAAYGDGVLDIAFSRLDTPVGELLLAATPRGLLRVAFESEDHHRVLDGLAERVGPRVLESRSLLEAPREQLAAYFRGTLRAFDLPLDLCLTRGFGREVVDHLPTIGYGRTQTYAEVAVATGRPAAVRAVGTACGRNPLPIVVPCHRVVRSDGGMGGYLGGVEAKELLLRLEGATT